MPRLSSFFSDVGLSSIAHYSLTCTTCSSTVILLNGCIRGHALIIIPSKLCSYSLSATNTHQNTVHKPCIYLHKLWLCTLFHASSNTAPRDRTTPTCLVSIYLCSCSSLHSTQYAQRIDLVTQPFYLAMLHSAEHRVMNLHHALTVFMAVCTWTAARFERSALHHARRAQCSGRS